MCIIRIKVDEAIKYTRVNIDGKRLRENIPI